MSLSADSPGSAFRRALARAATIVAMWSITGCRTIPNQSALDPAGPVAGRLHDLWWFAFITASVVYLATIGAMIWAAARARRRERRGWTLPADSERRMTIVVAAAVGGTVAILLAFISADLSAGRTLRVPIQRDPLTIQLIGRQWWWEVRYPGSTPQEYLTTANEIHVPTGRPVLLELRSSDVIHSVWVPNLAGKKDLIPGYVDTTWFQADSPGVYRGQCAEFCGHQHAKMALEVVAHSPGDFERWRAQSLQPAAPPTDSVTRRGQEVFMAGTCAMCHSIEGTPAGSNNGPNLTHLASRRTIAAGTLPNNRGSLAGWIIDPQQIKPGVNMPPNQLSPDDLDALLTYLQSLR